MATELSNLRLSRTALRAAAEPPGRWPFLPWPQDNNSPSNFSRYLQRALSNAIRRRPMRTHLKVADRPRAAGRCCRGIFR